MPRKLKVLFVYPNTQMATLVPINISLLSACLMKNGIDVKLFDTTYYKIEEKSFEERRVEILQLKPFSYEDHGVNYKKTNVYEDFRQTVIQYQPDLIAITLVEDTFDLGKSLLSSIKDLKTPVIAGGVFVTFSPDEVLSEKNIDMICLGEGEDALVELCKRMQRKENYENIKNLWIKKDNGQIVKNPLRKLTNLDHLPFINYDIFDKRRLLRPMHGKIRRMIHMEIDRGCPYDCTYCEAPHLRKFFKEQGCGKYHRKKDSNRLIAEMEYLIERYKPDYINFNSESFLARTTKDLETFAEKYKRIGLPFWCQTRPETVNEEKIKILKSMNCTNLQFGIEHGNEEFREKVLNRHCTNKDILKAFSIVEKAKIHYTVNNIIGFPDETRQLVFDTINLNKKIRPVTMNCYMFTPYKGTRLYQYCLEKKYIDKNSKVHQALDGTPLNMNTISYEELKGLQRTFSLYVRLPEDRYEEIRVAERFDEEGNKAFERLKREYQELFYN